MLTTCRFTRLLPVAALLSFALGGCRDVTSPAPVKDALNFSQVSTGPVVNSLADPGDGVCDDTECTLREAIDFAAAGATIGFDVTGTITQDEEWGGFIIEKALTIAGPGAAQLSISAGNSWRVLTIHANGATVEISGVTIRDGSASTGGGGVMVGTGGGNVLLAQAVITASLVHSDYGQGGGLFLSEGATLTLRNSTVSENSATGMYANGGGIFSLGTLILERTTVSGNSSGNSGGGVEVRMGTTTLTNSTISTNTANLGGGMIMGSGGTSTIVNSTITANTEYGFQNFGTLSLTNSILTGNGTSDLQNYGTATVAYTMTGTMSGYSVTDGGGNITSLEPGLGSLASNGGYTRTHALLSTSPAIDAGTSTGCPATDQRGVSRPQGSECDMGAYEYSTGSLLTPTFTFDLSSQLAKAYGDAAFSVAQHVATTSSGVVTFANGTESVGCSVTSGGTVTITGVAIGSDQCIVEASLASDGIYEAAGPISQSFNIAKGAGSVTIANIPSSPTVGTQFTPTFNSLGDGTPSVESTTPSVCTVSSGEVSFIAAGTCALQASITEGTNYVAAMGNLQSFTVFGAFEASCTYSINVKNGQRQVLVSWVNANPGVTLIQIVDGRVTTKQMAPTTTGSWSTNVKSGVPTYGLWGGTGRKDSEVVLVPPGTACTQ